MTERVHVLRPERPATVTLGDLRAMLPNVEAFPDETPVRVRGRLKGQTDDGMLMRQLVVRHVDDNEAGNRR